MSEQVSFGDAVAAYANDANRKFGTVPDSVFEESLATSLQKHQANSHVSQLNEQFQQLESELPGKFEYASSGDAKNNNALFLHWCHGSQVEQTLEDGSPLGIDVFAITSLGRTFHHESGTYSAVSFLDGDTTFNPEEIMGVQRTTVGRNAIGRRQFDYPGLREHLAATIMQEPTRLVVGVAAKAHLPDAPLEILPVRVDLPLGKAAKMIKSIVSNQEIVGLSRQAIVEAGAPASSENAQTFYDRLLGFTHEPQPDWLDGVKVPHSMRFSIDLNQFRADSAHATELLTDVSINSRITYGDAPVEFRKQHLRSFWINNK